MLVLLPRNPPVVHLQQERPKVAATHQHGGFVDCLVKHPFSDAWYLYSLYEAAAARQTEETSAEALTHNARSHWERPCRSTAPSLYWIVFIYYFSRLEYNWSWTRILRGSSSSRDENGMCCGASELQVVVVVVFPFSLPISFAPFLRREVQESLLYPVVWAGRKASGRLRATRRRRSKENHSTAFEPFFLLLFLQSNNSTFSLLFFRCINFFSFPDCLFLPFSFISSSHLLDASFLPIHRLFDSGPYLLMVYTTCYNEDCRSISPLETSVGFD